MTMVRRSNSETPSVDSSSETSTISVHQHNPHKGTRQDGKKSVRFNLDANQSFDSLVFLSEEDIHQCWYSKKADRKAFESKMRKRIRVIRLAELSGTGSLADYKQYMEEAKDYCGIAERYDRNQPMFVKARQQLIQIYEVPESPLGLEHVSFPDFVELTCTARRQIVQVVLALQRKARNNQDSSKSTTVKALVDQQAEVSAADNLIEINGEHIREACLEISRRSGIFAAVVADAQAEALRCENTFLGFDLDVWSQWFL